MNRWTYVPYDGVGEHLLALPPPERVEVPAAAAVDGEADDGVGGEDAAQGGEQRVAQRQEHVPLEPDPAVAVAVAAGRLLVPRGLPRDRLERHGRGRVAALAVAVRFPAGGVHDVEHDALGAAPEHGHRLEVLQAQLPRRRRRDGRHCAEEAGRAGSVGRWIAVRNGVGFVA